MQPTKVLISICDKCKRIMYFLYICIMAKRYNIDLLVNTKINYLLIIGEGEPHKTISGYIHRTVVCKCDCNKIKSFQLSLILNKSTKSCGCHSAKMAKNRMAIYAKTHGETLTTEYNTWQSMKKRCLNVNHKYYKDYGGRGITVCNSWLNSYENFILDMGKKPNKTLSLDRINYNLGYFKENCRWVTQKEQCRNVRNNINFEYNGEIKCIGEWREVFNFTRYKTIKFLKENGVRKN